MKVLCEYTPAGPSHVRSGWGRVFAACGHSFRFWNPQTKPAFDAFTEYEPDLLIACTYSLDRALVKNIVARPDMRVILFASAWGPYLKDVDLTKYPLVVATEQERKTVEQLKRETGKPDFVFIHAHDRWLEGTMSGWGSIGVKYLGVLNAADTFIYTGGSPRPELVCDAAMCGGYWSYKARNLDRFVLPLCHQNSGLGVKIFGTSPWPTASYLGAISAEDERDLYRSATVCLNVSEPHSTDLGWDVIERPFKVAAAGGFCVSDRVDEARDLFTPNELPMGETPGHFAELVRYFVEKPGSRDFYAGRMRTKVLARHTYFERVATFWQGLGMPEEAARTLRVKKGLVPCD